MNNLTVEDMAIAPGVIETITSLAVSEVDGVAAVGLAGSTNRSLRSVFSMKPSTSGVDVEVDENGLLCVSVHIDVYYGAVLPVVAEAVRVAIDQAFESQLGVSAGSVDVYVDGIQFAQ